jgi:hypothetical protein
LVHRTAAEVQRNFLMLVRLLLVDMSAKPINGDD